MNQHAIKLYLILSVSIMTSSLVSCHSSLHQHHFTWSELSPVPDPHGFAGSFAGVSNGVLIVAGGANFPDGGAPWTGSSKAWYDKIFILAGKKDDWKECGKLPFPVGYGVSASWNNALICVGGSNKEGHHAKVFMLRYVNDTIVTSFLPDLPTPLANSCGAIVNDVLYVAGGIDKPDAKAANKNFWSLDLTAATPSWKILSSWPGAGRMLSVAGNKDGSFFLFGGAALVDGNRRYLQDAFRYTPGNGWKKISDMPSLLVAAPGPAYNGFTSQLLIFGGDDGKDAANAATLKEKHPGFSTNILCYDTDKNTWSVAGTIATAKKPNAATAPNESVWAPVTTPMVVWNDAIIFPGGEVRPATRTPKVLMAVPVK